MRGAVNITEVPSQEDRVDLEEKNEGKEFNQDALMTLRNPNKLLLRYTQDIHH